MNEIKLFCPATIANISCGFDVLGLCLEAVGDEMIIRKSEIKGIRIIKIDGAELPLEASKNVAGVAALALLDAIDYKFGFEIEIHKNIKPGSGIGSSAASAAGAVFGINELLGKPYRLTGIVVEGQKLGRQLGFPTANLMIDEPHKLIPPNGVYLGFAIIQNIKYKIMLNIGVRPTVDGKSQTIEAHIIDFNENIYNQKLTIYLVQFLREEQRFDGLDALKIQLQKDEAKTRAAQLL